MGKLLLWFGILYGNLSALVGLAVLVVWWTQQASGQSFCSSLGLSPMGCRSGLLLADIVVMGVATVMSFRRLSEERRTFELEQKKSSGDSSGPKGDRPSEGR